MKKKCLEYIYTKTNAQCDFSKQLKNGKFKTNMHMSINSAQDW